LLVQREPSLAAEVEQYRMIASALSLEARSEPSARWDDAAILRSVPLEHYRNAPTRRLWPVIERVPFLARWLRRTRRIALAAAFSYGLVLLAGHSFLSTATQAISGAIHGRLSEWASASAGVPVLAQLFGAAAWSYDALAKLVAGLDAIFGTPLLTLALGMTFGMLCWHMAAARRRQQA
jgi:hypothetical protein